MTDPKMKIGIGLATLLFVAGVLLALAQLWFVPWSAEDFIKIEMTIGGFFIVAVVVCVVIREYRENKATRSGDRLDG